MRDVRINVGLAVLEIGRYRSCRYGYDLLIPRRSAVISRSCIDRLDHSLDTLAFDENTSARGLVSASLERASDRESDTATA
jgi:hypothetical protein